MTKIERATLQMERWAKDPAHGYDQQYRWGQRGDFDCSAAVIQAWELAGVPVKSGGATYTGNMKAVFLRCGFADVTASVNRVLGTGLQRGDVLLNEQRHTAMYIGNGQEVEASINELGGTTGGQPGDQTGREFLVRPYRNYPWDCVLRYIGDDTDDGTTNTEAARPGPVYEYSVKLGLLKEGMEDPQIKTVQQLLAAKGYEPGEADGIMGSQTVEAVKEFQGDMNLEQDGEVGGQTWEALLKK
ncbi:MAG TPA: peptidoglycan-binding protein [Candidatus Limivicinus faecipullorum]|nr:peptidoglycan-binding protein [Candidatus Limivicinus faecipullorum]